MRAALSLGGIALGVALLTYGLRSPRSSGGVAMLLTGIASLGFNGLYLMGAERTWPGALLILAAAAIGIAATRVRLGR